MENVSSQYSNTLPRQKQRRLQREHSKSSSKLKWNNVKTEVSKKSLMSPSLEIKDYDPSFALRKIAMLYEKDNREEVINIISNLSIETLLDIYKDFPIELFVDSIPQTLGILDCLFSRLFRHNAEKFPKTDFSLATLVMHIVKLYNRQYSSGLPKMKNWESIRRHCKSILKITGYVDGTMILKMLRHRRRCLHRAVESLGKHGLVEVEITPSSEENIIKKLLSLPEALEVELERMIINSKNAQSKLTIPAKHGEAESKTLPRPSTKARPHSHYGSSAPTELNHQRIMGLTTSHIQERLYDNKVLLNVAEPVMQYAQLPWLLDLLQERIERDKDVLLTFSQLRKEIPSVPSDAKLSEELMRYSEAFTKVIDILKEYVDGDTEVSDVPIQSENDFTPYVCDGKYFNTSSTPNTGRSSSGSVETLPRKSALSRPCTPKQPADVQSKTELERLRKELKKAQQTIEQSRKREKDLVLRLSKQAETFISKSPNYENIESGAPRPTELIRKYRNLYSEGRVQAFDAIDEIFRTEGGDSDNEKVNDVKTKLLFSVIVLSFRSVGDTLDQIRITIRDTLCMSLASGKSNLARETEMAMFSFLKNTSDTFDVSQNFREVFDRVCDALFECPELRSSTSLQSYAAESVHLAWLLTIQTPAFTIEYDAKYFDPSRHERFHTSDNLSNEISSFLWPSLLERESGKCLSKGIVVTG